MDISPKQLMEAIEQIAYDRKIPAERILETVEAALAAAYRKDFGHPEQMIRVKLNAETGETEVYEVFDIVAKKDDVENEHTQITVTEAKKEGDKEAKTGGEHIVRVKPPEEYGRIAAQTAKQVIIQRIREVEREIVQEEFSGREGELLTGSVQRIEGRNVFVEIGRALGVMRPEDQIQRERYYIGQRLRILLRELDPEGRGAQLLLSRSHPDFVRRLFELEVPEIHAGTVEIASIAREAGVRTKVAVKSNQEGVDPVGTCVGQRGTRVQAIMAELGEEKIDIVLYDEDAVTYIMNALSPAKISRIDLHEDTKTADIIVADDQLSLAIGRGGQNVRLAGELTGWQLDIDKTETKGSATADDSDGVVAGMPIDGVPGVSEAEAVALTEAGLGTAQQLAAASGEELGKVEAIEPARRVEIQAAAADAISGADTAAEPTDEPAPATEAKTDESEVAEEAIAEEVADAAVEDAEAEVAATPADPDEPSPDELAEVEELADEAKADAAKDVPADDTAAPAPKADEPAVEPESAKDEGASDEADSETKPDEDSDDAK
jgi:N utilization substance protein A